MASPDHSRELAEAAADLAGEVGEQLTTAMICKLAVDLIGPCDHASISIRGKRGAYRSLASSSATADALDSVQHEENDGPAITLVNEEEALLSDDLAIETRWPGWTQQAIDHGVASLMCIQLRGNAGQIGSINMYSNRPRSWDEDAAEVALLYAAHAAIAMDAAQIAEGLHTANASRHQIGLAQGILMERYGLSVVQSFALLQRYSSTSNTKLSVIAGAIIGERDGGFRPLGPR